MNRVLKIKDLAAPVTASKADWLTSTDCMSFTPFEGGLQAHNQCQSTINRQFGNGYVLEYITEQFSEPNPGFETDPNYLAEREAHRDVAGRLIAVHRLRATTKPLAAFVGPKKYERLQDMWAQDGRRWRWSVAFPIKESYDIIEKPKAKAVFQDAYRRLYGRPSAILR